MTDQVLQKNISPVTHLLRKRFGLFKSLVIKKKQYNLFQKTQEKYMSEFKNLYKKEDRLAHFQKMFNYLYSVRDIWKHIKKFSHTFKTKLFEFAFQEPKFFKKYLVSFEYICPYQKRGGNKVCSKKVNGDLCSKHKNSRARLFFILSSLEILPLPDDISNIVFRYALPYSLKAY